MSTYVDEVEQFKTDAPEAYRVLADAYEARTKPYFGNEYDPEEIEDLKNLVEFIKYNHDRSEETIDSCDITVTYRKTIGRYEYLVVGVSARKDQCVCEQELDMGIDIYDLQEEAEELLAIQERNRLHNRQRWFMLLNNGTQEEALSILEKIDYPG